MLDHFINSTWQFLHENFPLTSRTILKYSSVLYHKSWRNPKCTYILNLDVIVPACKQLQNQNKSPFVFFPYLILIQSLLQTRWLQRRTWLLVNELCQKKYFKAWHKNWKCISYVPLNFSSSPMQLHNALGQLSSPKVWNSSLKRSDNVTLVQSQAKVTTI